jgi:hypothetical protein
MAREYVSGYEILGIAEKQAKHTSSMEESYVQTCSLMHEAWLVD